MSTEPLFSTRNRWFTASVAVTGGLVLFSALFGFIVLPLLQTSARFNGVWDAICSAAGVLRTTPATEPVVQEDHPMTQVVMMPRMLQNASAEDVGRGATLALACTMCHGARGMSEANSPNLAGQYPAAIYKELMDFKSGARASAVMAPLVAHLSDQDMRDLAAYYAYLPRVRAYHPPGNAPLPQIVLDGAPMRNIAPCGACHGDLDNKAGSPWLEGQPAAYLQAQLTAFATGARRNNINGQMRNVARNMTPAEIAASVRYYAAQP